MYAYALDGTPIVSTKEMTPGSCDIEQGTFRRLIDGSIEGDHPNGTSHDYDQQFTVEERAEGIFFDDAGDEWPACAIILLPKALEEDAELPAELVAKAQEAYDAWKAEAERSSQSRSYTVDIPTGGWRTLASFSDEERRKLRPVAETLAILDGNAFFGVDLDDDGDDRFYQQYLPEAAALIAANGGWAQRASFMRGDTPLETGIPGIIPSREHDGRPIVDLVDKPDVLIDIVGIEWDVDENDIVDGLRPHLPENLLAGVPSDWGDDSRFVDLLSDRYGYCIKSVTGSVTEINGN